MTARAVSARAPGKLAVLGEYAVLEGAPALVLAVDRRCRAAVEARPGRTSRIETFFPEPASVERRAGMATGVPLVDVVLEAFSGEERTFGAAVDSRELFSGGEKLGLGSSAAALCAFAGAWSVWRGGPIPSLETLIALHRRFQGGTGSGLDVAASLTGGAIVFRSGGRSLPDVSSVQLPNSVGFAGIFAGRSASTPNLLARYHSWRAARPAEAAERQRILERIAEAGCAAVGRGESEGLLRAVELYGREMGALGRAIGAEIVTAEHEALASAARRFGVAYKVSGAGGGDLGIALSTDPDALDAFERTVEEQGFDVVDMSLDLEGLLVEERTE